MATAISLPVEVSMTVLTAIYVPALAIFVRGIREAHRFEGPPEEHLGGAHARLAMAHQAREAGSLRVAIVDASAAVDLAQSVDRPVRRRRPAVPTRRAASIARSTSTYDVSDNDALRALELADSMLSAVSPT